MDLMDDGYLESVEVKVRKHRQFREALDEWHDFQRRCCHQSDKQTAIQKAVALVGQQGPEVTARLEEVPLSILREIMEEIAKLPIQTHFRGVNHRFLYLTRVPRATTALVRVWLWVVVHWYSYSFIEIAFH